jgi:hypothetical protein
MTRKPFGDPLAGHNLRGHGNIFQPTIGAGSQKRLVYVGAGYSA